MSTALNAAFRRRQTVWADPAPSSDNGLLAFLSVFSASSSSFPFSLSVSLSLSPPHTPRGMYIPHARVRTGNFLNDHICLGVFPNGSVSTHIICSFLFVTTLLKNRVFFLTTLTGGSKTEVWTLGELRIKKKTRSIFHRFSEWIFITHYTVPGMCHAQGP